MKGYIIMLGICMLCMVVPTKRTHAQAAIAYVIKQAVKKVIKAVDLQIQRIQNKTIALQNAQKVLENKMSELKLNEITDWVDKQKKLYQDYFDELSKVKTIISGFYQVKDIIAKQKRIVSEYQQAYHLFKSDKDFSPDEISYMYKVYTGILNESVKNLNELTMVINAFSTQMTDGKRLEIIHRVAANIETNLNDLRQFNTQSKIIGLQRAGERNDIEQVRKLYGLGN